MRSLVQLFFGAAIVAATKFGGAAAHFGHQGVAAVEGDIPTDSVPTPPVVDTTFDGANPLYIEADGGPAQPDA